MFLSRNDEISTIEFGNANDSLFQPCARLTLEIDYQPHNLNNIHNKTASKLLLPTDKMSIKSVLKNKNADMGVCKKNSKILAASNAKQKAFRFSETSMLAFYSPDEQYDRTKSYSASDYTWFSHNTLRETMNIMKKLESCNKQDLSISSQLKLCGIDEEETIGLEHFLVSGGPKSIRLLRKVHAQAILKEKVQLKEGSDENPRKLAQLSIGLSMRPASEARKRAKNARAA